MSARCVRHGLATTPDGTCVRCRTEEAERRELLDLPKPERATRKGAMLVGLGASLAILGAGLALGWARATGRTAQTTRTTPDFAASRAHAANGADLAPALSPLVTAPLPDEPKGASSRARDEAERLSGAMHHVPIVLYGTPSDPMCAQARTWLLSNGYPFSDRDVTNDADAARARDLIAPGVVPVLVVGGQPLVGFDRARVTRALEYGAARDLQR